MQLKNLLIITIILFGLNFTSSAQTKTSDTEVKLVNFYPSPASAVISFDFQSGGVNSYSLLLFNFMGKKVYESKIISQHLDILLTDFYRGIYIYQLRDIDGHILESGKFQVIK
jgi:type IX secretion system substrate protein